MSNQIITKHLKSYIRDVPDFPKKGVIFKDITTLLRDQEAFRDAVDCIVNVYRDKAIEYVVGVEARGFILGSVIAYQLNAGFVPIRKKGKLPYKTESMSYDLEYGSDTLEIHKESFSDKARVLIVDDLLATGGTIKAVTDLVLRQGVNIVALAFLIELSFLKGREPLSAFNIFSVLDYE